MSLSNLINTNSTIEPNNNDQIFQNFAILLPLLATALPILLMMGIILLVYKFCRKKLKCKNLSKCRCTFPDLWRKNIIVPRNNRPPVQINNYFSRDGSQLLRNRRDDNTSMISIQTEILEARASQFEQQRVQNWRSENMQARIPMMTDEELMQVLTLDDQGPLYTDLDRIINFNNNSFLYELPRPLIIHN